MKKITTLLFILASHLANAQINLKLNVQPGFKMKGVYDMTMKMSMMGKKMDMHALYYISGIANNTNDKKETEWTFIVDSLIMDSKQGKEVHHINSNDPKTMQDAPSKITDAVGKKILVMVDEFGNVKSMENKDESAMIIKSLFIQFAGKEIAKKEKTHPNKVKKELITILTESRDDILNSHEEELKQEALNLLKERLKFIQNTHVPENPKILLK